MSRARDIREALRTVQDPVLGRSLLDLGMVRNINSDGAAVSIEIAVIRADGIIHPAVQEGIVKAVRALSGVERVNVSAVPMTERERRHTATVARRPLSAALQGPAPHTRGAPLATVGLAASPEARVIGIASGKGGVGKSTVTANLAVMLAQMGYRIGLIDMDVYGFSQGRLFGVETPAQADDDRRIVPWRAHGIDLVSMGMFVAEERPIMWRGPMLGKVMQQFFRDVAWRTLDYLLLDLPPGTGDTALDMAQRVPSAEIVLVTTPQPVAARVAVRTGQLAHHLGQTLVGVIENMSYTICPHGERWNLFGQGGGQELADELGIPLLGQVPLEMGVREGGDAGRPVVLADPTGPAASEFRRIAERLTASRPHHSGHASQGVPSGTA